MPKIGKGFKRFVKKGDKRRKKIVKRFVDAKKGPRKVAPPNVRKLIKKKGDKMINRIIVSREPVSVNKVLNMISLGKFQKTIKDLDYETIFHLYLILFFEDGSILRLEKNEVVSIEWLKKYKRKKNKEDREIDLKGETIRLDTFINNGEKQQEDFWSYRAGSNNCQDFVMSCIKGNNLETDFSFIKQDASAIFKGLPKGLKKVANFLTDLAGSIDIIRRGV